MHGAWLLDIAQYQLVVIHFIYYGTIVDLCTVHAHHTHFEVCALIQNLEKDNM